MCVRADSNCGLGRGETVGRIWPSFRLVHLILHCILKQTEWSLTCLYTCIAFERQWSAGLLTFVTDLNDHVGFEVFTAVVMKSINFWDMTSRSPLGVNRRFRGTYRLHLHGRRNKFSKKPLSILLSICLLGGFLQNLFLRPWRWRRYIPPKRGFTLNGLHGVIWYSYQWSILGRWYWMNTICINNLLMVP
jgi:hypothetical protein